MRLNAVLHWLVVVRHDREDCIGAGEFGLPGQLDRMARGIRTGSGNDADTATRNFDGGADDRVVFGWHKRRGFAGCFADDDCGCAGLYLTLAESFKGYQVYSACLVEGGREIGDVARK